MKTFAKIALRAMISSVAIFLGASCASAADRDPCDYDISFCIYPVYQGAIFIGGARYEGRFRYRFHENKGTREYWVNNDWHLADVAHDGSGGGPH